MTAINSIIINSAEGEAPYNKASGGSKDREHVHAERTQPSRKRPLPSIKVPKERYRAFPNEIILLYTYNIHINEHVIYIWNIIISVMRIYKHTRRYVFLFLSERLGEFRSLHYHRRVITVSLTSVKSRCSDGALDTGAREGQRAREESRNHRENNR